MRKIVIILIILSVCLASCSDNDDAISEVKVLESDVLFEAMGGQGTIKVETIGTISAEPDQDWCTVTTDGYIIKITVEENNAIEGRTAAVTIKAGESQTLVPISQKGGIASYNKSELGQILPYAGGSVSVNFSSNVSIHVEIPEEAKSWLSYNFDAENELLTFTALPSLDNKPRGAAVSVISAGKKAVYHIGSYELKDIAGIWDISFIDKNDGSIKGEIEIYTIESNETAFYIDGISDFIPTLPLVFKDGALRIMAATRVGIWNAAQSQYIYTAMLSEGGGVYWNSIQSYVAYPSSVDGKFAFVFGDDGSMKDDNINGFAYWVFQGTPSNSTSIGYLEFFIDLMLRK